VYGSASQCSNLPLTQCSPFSLDIVHAVAYSLLLLNTDLHVADLSSRMSRGQFVKNTMTAIQMQIRPHHSASISSDLTYDDCSSSVRSPSFEGVEQVPRSKRSDSSQSWNSVSKDIYPRAPSSMTQHVNSSTPSVQVSVSSHDQRPTPFHTYNREWEEEMGIVLKVIPYLVVDSPFRTCVVLNMDY